MKLITDAIQWVAIIIFAILLGMLIGSDCKAQISPVITAETQITMNGNLNHSILAGINTFKDDQVQIGPVFGKARGFALNVVLQATDLFIVEIQHQSLKYKGEFDRKSTIAGLFGVKKWGVKVAVGGILGDYDTKRDFSEGIGVIGKVGYSVKF